ncbi:hypothetical protein [Rhizobium sp.]|jgi:hypothetical protein|uniref:hypothetical protein n=1 Tax=Rhizobium sp. TaxID=391 RepID=UPI000E821743|nr:hypothetical protein [Rhizobium sp.]
MKVFIEANGQVRGTTVKDEHGNGILGVSGVEFAHHVGDMPAARLTIILPVVSIECEAKAYGPDGREIIKIMYADGTETEY